MAGLCVPGHDCLLLFRKFRYSLRRASSCVQRETALKAGCIAFDDRDGLRRYAQASFLRWPRFLGSVDIYDMRRFDILHFVIPTLLMSFPRMQKPESAEHKGASL